MYAFSKKYDSIVIEVETSERVRGGNNSFQLDECCRLVSTALEVLRRHGFQNFLFSRALLGCFIQGKYLIRKLARKYGYTGNR